MHVQETVKAFVETTAFSLSGYTPLYCFMDLPPLRIVSLRLKASTSSFGLLCHANGACVDDVTTLAWPQGGIDQFLVFLASPPVGACQGLSCSHHHLKDETWIKLQLHLNKNIMPFLCAYHAILPVIVTQYWKAATLTEGSYFPQCFIVNIFGHRHK